MDSWLTESKAFLTSKNAMKMLRWARLADLMTFFKISVFSAMPSPARKAFCRALAEQRSSKRLLRILWYSLESMDETVIGRWRAGSSGAGTFGMRLV